MTNFIHERVYVGNGLSVVIDGNSKITAGNGTFEDPKPNAFSLPAASVDGQSHCPGSTSTCRASCYVRGLAKSAVDVYDAYHANARTLDAILSGSAVMGFDTARRLGAWIEGNAMHGFRWHVSGDVRSAVHAMRNLSVCRNSRTVRHWIYTRTFDNSVMAYLTSAANLTVNVSADRENFAAAKDAATRFGARIAYMASPGEDVPPLPDGSVIFPDYPLRGRELDDPREAPWWKSIDHRTRLMVCPADFFGQSDSMRCGPCTKCIDAVTP
jgi:hypothetical protein